MKVAIKKEPRHKTLILFLLSCIEKIVTPSGGAWAADARRQAASKKEP